MSTFILGDIVSAMLGWLMAFLSVFLILLILVQRGRGGGLTGALGGAGGQSAFGSKAGDTFTVITIVVASIWGFTCAFAMWKIGTHTPKTTVETNLGAGPGDDIKEDPTSGIVIPKPTDTSGLSGLGDPGTTETPSMELKPKQPEAETPVEADPKPEPETSSEPEPKTQSDSTPTEQPSSQRESEAEPAADEGDKQD